MLPLPLPTRNAAQGAFGGANRNPGLLFDRYAPENIEGNAKAEFLENIRQAAAGVDADLMAAHIARWKALVKQFNGQVVEMETDWRFLTGIGVNNRSEVGFLFDRYGFPSLPGSGCKGVARAYALSKKSLQHPEMSLVDLDKKLSAEDEEYKTIFGNQGAAGKAIFFAGIPAHTPELQVDVMTPHFGEYYTGDKMPKDSFAPVPLPFLVVAPKQKFLFAVGWRGEPLDEGRLKGACDWLREGLEWLGAGAKTSAGYGYFRSQ